MLIGILVRFSYSLFACHVYQQEIQEGSGLNGIFHKFFKIEIQVGNGINSNFNAEKKS